VLTRGYPTTGSDAGIFLSVAGRLLAGDKLFRDVFDNKGPLFYYSDALALWGAGWRGPFLLDVAWLFVASAGAYLLLRRITNDPVVAVFGQLLYPLLLTGIYFRDHTGYSELPGLSLLPLLAYLVYCRKPVLGGFAAAVILLLKADLLPVVMAVGVAGFVSERGRRLASAVLFFVVATALGVSLIFLVLVIRGEAGAYVATLRENAGYQRRALQVVFGWSGIRGHLLVVRALLPSLARDLMVAVVAFTAVVILAGGGDARRRLLGSRLAVMTLAASLGTLVMLAETALWNHQLQALAFPIFLGGALALECTRMSFRRSRRLWATGAVAAVAAYFVLAALFLNPPRLANVRAWSASPTHYVSNVLQSASEQTKGMRTPLSYFHLGGNDETGQGAFLDSSFQLACPRFHQYPFSPPTALRETIRCMERRRPQLIAVTPLFREDWYGDDRGPPAWIHFVQAARSDLRSRCRLAVDSERVRVYVCGERT
jgi:hypothetical protein